MTYSIDFRKKVFDYKDKHELTFEQVSEHFEVSMRSLFRWEKELEPATTKKRPALKVDMDMLKNDVKMLPDSYQWERAQRLGVGQPAIHYALKRLNLSYKKNSVSPKSLRK